MRDAAIPISILLGFTILAAAVYIKENDFETCVRLYSEAVPTSDSPKRGMIIARECTGQ